MSTSTRTTQLTHNSHFLPHIFSATFLQLDHIRAEHSHMMGADRMMGDKLDHIASALKQLAASDEPVPDALGQLLATQISKTSSYAKDMAEEEQRIIAESHDSAAGNEETEAEEYFVISDQLGHCASTLKRNLEHFNQL